MQILSLPIEILHVVWNVHGMAYRKEPSRSKKENLDVWHVQAFELYSQCQHKAFAEYFKRAGLPDDLSR